MYTHIEVIKQNRAPTAVGPAHMSFTAIRGIHTREDENAYNIHRTEKYLRKSHYHLIYRRDFLLLASLAFVDVLPTEYPLPFASARTSTCTPWSSLLLPLLPVLAESTS